MFNKNRQLENLHIIFWIFKDISWCILLKPLGIAMIFPTLIIALVIAWRTRHFISEACHSIAIVFWIIANSYWMLTEFFEFDTEVFYGHITFKHIALLPFILGALTLAWYYLYWKPNNTNVANTM